MQATAGGHTARNRLHRRWDSVLIECHHAGTVLHDHRCKLPEQWDIHGLDRHLLDHLGYYG